MSNTVQFFEHQCRKMKPTQKHQVAMFSGILGTVWAVSPDGRRCEYFDYDYKAAAEYVGITDDSDLRVFKTDQKHHFQFGDNPMNPLHAVAKGQFVLWARV